MKILNTAPFEEYSYTFFVYRTLVLTDSLGIDKLTTFYPACTFETKTSDIIILWSKNIKNI